MAEFEGCGETVVRKTVAKTGNGSSGSRPDHLGAVVPLKHDGGSNGNGASVSKFSAEDLFRRLAEQFSVVIGNGSPLEDPHLRTNGQVLADFEVDGVRCLLIWKGAAPANPLKLSPREREIARMIAKGYPNKAIAGVLEISSWTVDTHLRRIFSKLGVSCRAAMVAKLADLSLYDDNEHSFQGEQSEELRTHDRSAKTHLR